MSRFLSLLALCGGCAAYPSFDADGTWYRYHATTVPDLDGVPQLCAELDQVLDLKPSGELRYTSEQLGYETNGCATPVGLEITTQTGAWRLVTGTEPWENRFLALDVHHTVVQLEDGTEQVDGTEFDSVSLISEGEAPDGERFLRLDGLGLYWEKKR